VAVNLVAPFVLTTLLLQRSERARLHGSSIFLEEHRRGSIDIEDLEFKTRRYSPPPPISQSKLGVISFSVSSPGGSGS